MARVGNKSRPFSLFEKECGQHGLKRLRVYPRLHKQNKVVIYAAVTRYQRIILYTVQGWVL